MSGISLCCTAHVSAWMDKKDYGKQEAVQQEADAEENLHAQN